MKWLSNDFFKNRKSFNSKNKMVYKSTSEDINIIGPRSSLSISTFVRSSVFAICSVGVFRWRTPPLVLHTKHSEASLRCRQGAFLNGVSPSTIISLKKTASAFQWCYSSSACVPEAAKSLHWKKTLKTSNYRTATKRPLYAVMKN